VLSQLYFFKCNDIINFVDNKLQHLRPKIFHCRVGNIIGSHLLLNLEYDFDLALTFGTGHDPNKGTTWCSLDCLNIGSY
jgi:hypothetical protein